MRTISLVLVAIAACVNTTGGQTVTYDVAARGVGSNTLDTGQGWHVAFDRAVVHIGAVYLNLAVSNPEVSAGTECILPGIYTGQELAGIDVDVLSPARQPFPTRASGTDDEARTGEVWLTGGDVNASADPTLVADICGTASKAAMTIAFAANVTIGASNRLIKSSDPANPSAHPICKQRIVSPIAIDFRPSQNGTLLVTIDPTLWFANVDFATLPPATLPSTCPTPPTNAFPDDNSIPASQNLFSGLHSSGGTFTLTFE